MSDTTYVQCAPGDGSPADPEGAAVGNRDIRPRPRPAEFGWGQSPGPKTSLGDLGRVCFPELCICQNPAMPASRASTTNVIWTQ